MKPASVPNPLSVKTILSEAEGSLTSSFSKKLSFFIFFTCLVIASIAQDIITKDTMVLVSQQLNVPADEKLYSGPTKKRVRLIAGINVAGYGISLVALNNAWYKGYAKTSFHTFNDSREWLQLDKSGHAWGAYN